MHHDNLLAAKRKRHRPRVPDKGPWPEVGYITLTQLMGAICVRSPQSVYTYVQRGWLPAPVHIGPARIGWPVEQARAAVQALPQRIQDDGAVRAQSGRQIRGAA